MQFKIWRNESAKNYAKETLSLVTDIKTIPELPKDLIYITENANMYIMLIKSGFHALLIQNIYDIPDTKFQNYHILYNEESEFKAKAYAAQMGLTLK